MNGICRVLNKIYRRRTWVVQNCGLGMLPSKKHENDIRNINTGIEYTAPTFHSHSHSPCVVHFIKGSVAYFSQLRNKDRRPEASVLQHDVMLFIVLVLVLWYNLEYIRILMNSQIIIKIQPSSCPLSQNLFAQTSGTRQRSRWHKHQTMASQVVHVILALTREAPIQP